METLPLTTIRGTPREIGEVLGRLAKPVMRDYLTQSGIWSALQPWRGSTHLQRLMEMTRESLPDCWEELDGMASGIGMDAADLFLWNCRGDLLGEAAGGSTSVAVNRLANAMMAQNVDGDPLLGTHCHLVDVRPVNKPGFIGLYSPGSIPGHTFAANRSGLVHMVNQARPASAEIGMPGMMLCRRILDTDSLAEAIEILMETPCAGAQHHIMGWAGEFIMVSIETMRDTRSMTPIASTYGHANHMIHSASFAGQQIVTPSSRERQAGVSRLLRTLPDFPSEEELLEVLYDHGDGAAPIYRDAPDDPEAENTLATAIFRFTPKEINLRVFGKKNLLLQKQTIPMRRD
jgi:hypothetical protein